MSKKPWNAPIHPAEFLREDFLEPLGVDAERAAAALQLPLEDVRRFLAEQAPLTPDLALRLAKAFGCSAEYWMRWQTDYDLDVTRSQQAGHLDNIADLNPGRHAAE